MFCTHAEASEGEVIDAHQVTVTSGRGVGCLPSAQLEWTVFCLIA